MASKAKRNGCDHASTQAAGHHLHRDCGSVQLAAARHLVPLRQGDLDWLCAIYAVINAARLLLKQQGVSLSLVESSRLYAEASERLARKGALHEALTWGVEQRRQLAIARHVGTLVSGEDFTVSVERPVHARWSVQHMLAWIDDSLTAGKPVMIRLIGAELNHFTVVAGSSPNTLRLFDSGDRHYVRKDSIGLRTGTNVIPVSSLMRLALEPLG